MKHFLSSLKIILLFIGLVGSLQAQNWNQILKSVAGDRENKAVSGRTSADAFGKSVAINGDYALVGAFREKEDAEGKNFVSNAGAAYLFKHINGTWVKIKKLTAGDRNSLNYFGTAVAMSDGYAVVSASETDGRAIYIFKKDEGGVDNWGQVKKIPAPFYEGYGTGFGISVAIDGDYIIAGAPSDDRDASENNFLNSAGAAYIFKENEGGADNWGQIKKLTATTRRIDDYFGYSVGISGDIITIGAPGDDYDGQDDNKRANAGSVFVFRKDQGGGEQWGMVKKIVSSRRSYYGIFGTAVGISGDKIVIGASGEDFNYADNLDEQIGVAYIVKRNEGGLDNWGIRKMISAPVQSNYDRFGYSVAISGDQVIIGADQEDEDQNEFNTNSNTGSAYIFREGMGGGENWGLARKITAPARGTYDGFGNAVSINGENALVGAMEEDEDGREENTVDNSGSAYIYIKTLGGGENWGLKSKITASTGAPGSAYFGFSVSISGNYAVVGAKFDQLDSDGLNPISSAGAAYILFNDAGTWKEVKKICAPTRNSSDQFGAAVSINGDFVIVGAPYNAYDATENNALFSAGTGYIFQKDKGGVNNWGLVKKITSSIRASGDNFGNAVAIYGDYVAIGAFFEDEDTNEQNYLDNAGSVYLFKKDHGGTNSWGQLKKINAPLRSSYAGFGQSLSLSGNRLIVGAPYERISPNDYSENAGAAHIFEKDYGGTDNWGAAQKLVPNVRNSGSAFGNSVCIDGTHAIVGAVSEGRDEYESNFLVGSGAAYVFKKDLTGAGNWIELKKVVSQSRRAMDQFGSSVGISGDFAIVTATYGDETSYEDNSGLAVIIKKGQGGADNWGIWQRLSRTGSGNMDLYGFATAISGRYAIVGAPAEDDAPSEMNTITDTGAAYFFQNYDAPLPVTLTSFDAKKAENQAILTWKTTEETNSDYFEIQKSRDAYTWLALDERIPALGSGHSYSFVDIKPFHGENLYRLKMVDLDGTYAYSQIRNLTFNHDVELLIYPNPVSDRLFLMPSTKSTEIESVQIYNNLGQKVLSAENNIQDGLIVTTLSPGIFTVELKYANGNFKTQKILIVR